MAVSNSSLIGANFGASGTTALFALGTSASGTDGTSWQYCEATATFVTGELVFVNPAGTAKTFLTASLTANAEGVMIAAAQGIISQGEFGWFAGRGRNLYVLCTGTVTAGGETGVVLSANSGRLQNGLAGGVGNTLLGIFVTTSASTATQSVAVATLTWPRSTLMGA